MTRTRRRWSGPHCRASPGDVFAHDHTVSPGNSLRLSGEVPGCQLFEVPCDTHLIWIGPSAGAVWEKRLSFLTA